MADTRLDQYEQLRYPNRLNQIAIGSEHVATINALAESIYQRMPDTLEEAFLAINPLRKVGRVLMKRPKKQNPSIAKSRGKGPDSA